MKHRYFSVKEQVLWLGSMIVIAVSFFVCGASDYLSLAASFIGVTSLIFNSKGNPAGPFLMIFFSIIYGIISYEFAYYGEMLTYVGMTLPMEVFSLIVWLRHPYNGNKSEVEVKEISGKECTIMWVLTLSVTIVFYFILKAFNTANILPSTISVATSFLAVYLKFKRSPYYAAAYAANDIVLIVLWILAALKDISYFSVIVCFAVFLVNDIYGFVSWKKMRERQAEKDYFNLSSE